MSEYGISAINTLIDAAAQSLDYASTEVGTITGVELAKNGIYTVSVNGTSYRAYSALHDLLLDDRVLLAKSQDDMTTIKVILCKIEETENDNININDVSFLTDETRIVASEIFAFREIINFIKNEKKEAIDIIKDDEQIKLDGKIGEELIDYLAYAYKTGDTDLQGQIEEILENHLTEEEALQVSTAAFHQAGYADSSVFYENIQDKLAATFSSINKIIDTSLSPKTKFLTYKTQTKNSTKGISDIANSIISAFDNLIKRMSNIYNNLKNYISNIPSNINDFSEHDLELFLKNNTPIEVRSIFEYNYSIYDENSSELIDLIDDIYQLTEDEEVIKGKFYYEKIDDNYVLVKTVNLTESPKENGYYEFVKDSQMNTIITIPSLTFGNSIILDFNCDYLFNFYNSITESRVIPEYYICLKFLDSENNLLGNGEIEIPLLENSGGNIFEASNLPSHLHKQLNIPKQYLFDKNNDLVAKNLNISFKIKVQKQVDWAESLYSVITSDPGYQTNKKEIINQYLNFPSICWWPISFTFKVGVLSWLPNLLLIPNSFTNDTEPSETDELQHNINFLELLGQSYQVLDNKNQKFVIQFFNKGKTYEKALFNILFEPTSDTTVQEDKSYYKKEFLSNTNQAIYVSVSPINNPKQEKLYEGIEILNLKFFISLNGEEFFEDKNKEYIKWVDYENGQDYIRQLTSLENGLLNIDTDKYESYSFYATYEVNDILYKSNILTYMTQEEADNQAAAALGYTIQPLVANHNIFTEYNSINPNIYEAKQHLGQLGLYRAGAAVKKEEISSISWEVPEGESQIWLFTNEEEREKQTKPVWKLENSNPSIGFQFFDRFVFPRTKISCEVTLPNGQILKMRTYLDVNYEAVEFVDDQALAYVLTEHKYPMLFVNPSYDNDTKKWGLIQDGLSPQELTYKIAVIDKDDGKTVTFKNNNEFKDKYIYQESNTNYPPIGTFSQNINYIYQSNHFTIPFPNEIDENSYSDFLTTNGTFITTGFGKNYNSFSEQFTIKPMLDNDSILTNFLFGSSSWQSRKLIFDVSIEAEWHYDLPLVYEKANELKKQYKKSEDTAIQTDKEYYTLKNGSYSVVTKPDASKLQDYYEPYIYYQKNNNNYSQYNDSNNNINIILMYCYRDDEIFIRTKDNIYSADKIYYYFEETSSLEFSSLYKKDNYGNFIKGNSNDDNSIKHYIGKIWKSDDFFDASKLYERTMAYRRFNEDKLAETAYQMVKCNGDYNRIIALRGQVIGISDETEFNNYIKDKNLYYKKDNKYYEAKKYENSKTYYTLQDFYERIGDLYMLINYINPKEDVEYYQLATSDGSLNTYTNDPKILYREQKPMQPDKAFYGMKNLYIILANAAKIDINVNGNGRINPECNHDELRSRDYDFTKKIADYGGFYKYFAQYNDQDTTKNLPPLEFANIGNNLHKKGPNEPNTATSIIDLLTEIDQQKDIDKNFEDVVWNISPSSSSEQVQASSAKGPLLLMNNNLSLRSVDEEAVAAYALAGANQLTSAMNVPLNTMNSQLKFLNNYLEYMTELVAEKEKQLEDSLFIPRTQLIEPRLSGGKSAYDSPFWRRSPFQGYLYLANCTCYAWGRYAEVAARGRLDQIDIGLKKAAKLPTSHAGKWFQLAKDAGVCETRTLKEFLAEKNKRKYLGAVMCWGGLLKAYGHVAIVEGIEELGDGHAIITYSESNYSEHGTSIYMHGGKQLQTKQNMFRAGSLFFKGFILQ